MTLPVSPNNFETQASQELKNSYDAAQAQQQNIISQKSWLDKGHPLGDFGGDVDLKLLGLLDGDSFIHKTPLDGYEPLQSISHFNALTQQLLKRADENPSSFQFLASGKAKIENFQNEMQHCIEIESKFADIITKGQNLDEKGRAKLINDGALFLQKHFRTKQVGWLPLVWRTRNGEPHAMMARIDMNAGSFTIVNSGAGLHYHPEIKLSTLDKLTGEFVEETKNQQFLTISNVDRDRLDNFDFFKYLIEVQTVGAWQGLLEINEKNIYDVLPEFLKGKIDDPVDPYLYPDAYKTPQRSGTCTIKSVTAALYYMMSGILEGTVENSKERIDCFKKMRFLWQTHALLKFVKKNIDPSKVIDQADIGLLKDILENLSRGADKLHHDHLLSDQELEEVHATFLDVKARIQAIKEAPNVPKSHPVTSETTPAPVQEINIHLSKPIEGEERAINAPGLILEDSWKNEFDLNSLMRAEYKFTDPAQIRGALFYIASDFEKGYGSFRRQEGSYLKACRQSMLNKFAELVSALPDASLALGSFWHTIPEDQIAPCIRLIYNLMITLQNIHLMPGEMQHEADVTAMHYSLYAINVLLARRLKETRLDGFSIECEDLLCEMKSPSFIIQNPLLQKKLNSVLKYFYPAFKIEDLLVTDNNPFSNHEMTLFTFKYKRGSNTAEAGSMEWRWDEHNGQTPNENLRYYLQFLEDDEMKSNLYNHGECYFNDGPAQRLTASDSKLAHIASMLSGWYNVSDPSKILFTSFLPSSVEYLQNSAVLNQFHHYGTKPVNNQGACEQPMFTSGKCLIQSRYYESDKSLYFGLKPSYDSQGIELKLRPLQGDIQDANLKSCNVDAKHLKQFKERKKQNIQMIEQSACFDLGLDSSRELNMIGGDPYSEASRAISFARRHLFLLKNKDFQNLLKIHLFRHGRLLSQLQDQPEIAASISQFIQEAIKHYQQSEDLETCLVLAKLGNDLKLFIKQSGFEDRFPDFRTMIRNEFLPQYSDSWSNKKAIYKTLISFYEDVDLNTVKDNNVVLAQIAEDMYGYRIAKRMSGETISDEEKILTTALRLKFMDHVDRQLQWNNINRNALLDKLLGLVEPKSKKGLQWTTFTVNVSSYYENDEYHINLDSGLVIAKAKGEFVDLPQNIRDNEHFNKIFKGKIESCKMSKLYHPGTIKEIGSVYVINSGQENELTIRSTRYPNGYKEGLLNRELSSNQPTLQFEKTINSVKHRYVTEQELSSVQTVIPGLFKDNKFCCWMPIKNPDKIFAEQNGQEVFSATLKTQSNGALVVEKITKKDANGNVLLHVPFSHLKSKLEILAKCEPSEGFIECWSAQDGKEIVEVKCPRLGLRFLNKDGKLQSQEYPGYYLYSTPAKNTSIILENDSGQRKVLLPDLPIEPSYLPSSLGRALSYQADRSKVMTWMDFDVVGDDLKGRSTERRFQLVYLYSLRRNYEKAFETLNQIVGLGRFKDELTAIKTLVTFLKDEKHPAACALLLKLYLKVEENRLKYPLTVGFKAEEPVLSSDEMNKALSSYNHNISNMPHYRLSPAQEKRLYRDSKFQEKGDYLNSGVGKLGVRKVVKILNPLPKLNSIALDNIKEKFNDNFTNENVDTSDLFLSLIRDGKFFEQNFSKLYIIARSGSDVHREALRRMLELNGSLDSKEVKYLLQVYQSPDSYPSVEQIINIEREAHNSKQNVQNAEDLYQQATKHHLSIPDANQEEKSAALAKVIELQAAFIVARERSCDAARKKSDFYDEFAKNKETTLQRIINKIIEIWNHIKNFFAGEHSIWNKIREAFYELFRQKHVKPSEVAHCNRTPMNGNNNALEQADHIFNSHFDTLLNKYFDQNPSPANQDWKNDKESFTLPTDHAKDKVKKKLQKENEDLEFYRQNLKDQHVTYKLKNDVELKNLKEELSKSVDQLSIQLKTQKTALLWQVNQIKSPVQEQASKALNKQGQSKDLDWDELKKITLEGNIEAFQSRTDLNAEESEKVLVGISDYLIKSTRLDQMNTIIKAIDKAAEAKEDRKKKLLEHGVAEALSLIRGYKLDGTKIQRHWFEAASHYLYRKNQIDKINEVLDANSPEALAEMPTGFGKTKNVVPSLNFEKTKEGKLVINCWPASLEMTNTVDVQEQMENGYGKKVDRIFFERSSDISVESLKFLYEELVRDKEQGISVNIRSESVRAMQLHFLILLKMANNPDIKKESLDDLSQKISYFIKILKLFRTQGWITIDEAHVTLDPMDKLIYTLGEYHLVPPEQIQFLEELFDQMINNAEIASVIKIRDNQQHMLKEGIFENEIAPKLAEHFRVNKFKIDDSLKQSYEDFVLGKSGSIPEWVKNHSQRSLIALLKGELSQLLKSSLKVTVDEKFGLSHLHINEKEYAISYASSNTPKENETNPSQFKNHHETLNKTYLTYLHKGLEPFQVKKFIQRLKDQALEYSRAGSSLEQSPANQFFKKVLPDEKKLLMTLSDKDIERLIPALKGNTDVIFYYVKNIVVPKLRIYPDHLVSTVQNFKSQFASSLSLSATPPDPLSHGLNTHFIPMKGTSGRVTHLLLTKCKDSKSLHEIDAMAPDKVVDASLAIAGKSPHINAMIDAGALYKGLSNKDIAIKMCQQYKGQADAQAVVFFDEKQGLFKIMDVATEKVHDFAELKVDPEKCRTLYDQSRCVGSDLKQAVDAVGLLLTGKATTIAEACQAAGRMRELEREQSIEIGYQKELKQEIFGTNGANIKDLLVYWIANQAELEAEKNYQSQLDQMNNELRSSLIDKMLGLEIGNLSAAASKEPDVDLAIKLFGKNQTEFYQSDKLDPWEMYGPIPEDQDTKECLKAAKDRCLNRVENLNAVSNQEKGVIKSKLEAYQSKWNDMALPDKTKMNITGMGMECEVLQEVEVQQEIQQETQTQDEVVERLPKQWKEDLNLFQDNWMDAPKQNVTLMKVARVLDRAITKSIDKMTFWIPQSPYKHLCYVPIGLCVGGIVAGALAIASLALPIILGVGAVIAALIILVMYIPHIIRLLNKEKMVYRVKDVMKLNLPDNVASAAHFFNPNFLVSDNFYDQNPVKADQVAQTPFSKEQKPLFELLVMQEEAEGCKKIKVMAIDQNDSIFFHRKLKEDREQADAAASSRNRKIALYDIHNNIISVQGKNEFAKGELENNPTFKDLLANAKFLNGEINYSEEELASIEAKAQKVGIGAVGELFGKHILKNRVLNKAFVKNKEIAQRLALNATAA